MKLLIITSAYYPYVLGGAEVSTQILAEGLAKENDMTVDVLTLGHYSEIEIINQVKIIRTNIVKERDQILKNQDFKKIREKLKHRIGAYYSKKMYNFYYDFFTKNDYSILHISNPMRGFYPQMCLMAAKSAGIPILQSIRDTSFLMPYKGKNPLIKLYKNALKYLNFLYINKYSSHIHFPSAYVKNLFLNYKLNKPSSVVYNTIADNHLSTNRQKERQIIYVGRFEEVKGLTDLINIFNELDLKDYTLKLIGSGPLKIIPSKNIKISDWLPIKDVYSEISKSTLLVFPSKDNETFGRPIIEAIFNGTLVIGRKSGAIPEILNYDDDFLFETNEGMKEKILRILKLNEDKYQLELQRLTHLSNRYRSESQRNNFIEIYRSLITEEL